MVSLKRVCEISFLLVYMSVFPLSAVTVNPALCPTNKIAPHRRLYRVRERTFGAFYDLLTPGNNNGPYDTLNDLQEKPQEDDPDDCGDIEDYDENDLSSITSQSQRRVGYRDEKFFNNFYRPPPPRPNPGIPIRPTIRPQRPSYGPTRPPYWSGGFFGSNDYRPPLHQDPSEFIKPIHEYSENNQATYRPDLVGAPLGHIVGASQIRPTTTDFQQTTDRSNYYQNRFRTSTPPTSSLYTPRPSRPRLMNNNNNSGFFGSFVDLLFK